METIKKKINLSDFVERFGENELCVEGTNMPYDIKLYENGNDVWYGELPFLLSADTTEETFDIIIPTYEVDNFIGVRYGTLANYYSWIRNFIMQSKYYIFKNRKGEILWEEVCADLDYREEQVGKYDIFLASSGVFSGLSDDITEGFTCGDDIFCINENAEEFYDMYVSKDATEEYIRFFEDVILKGEYSTSQTLPPFIDFNVYVDEEIDEMGSLRQIFDDEEEWELTSYSGYSAFVESKLKSLVRQRISVDDSGNDLDFVYDMAINKSELRFVTGVPYNEVYDENENVYRYDIISSIRFSNDTIDYDNLTNEDVGKSGSVTFIYVIGNMLSGDTDVEVVSDDSGGGILYEETLDFVIKKERFTIGGYVRHVIYISIDYDSGEKPEVYEEGKRYAKIYVDDHYVHKYKEGEENNLYRDDRISGIEDIGFSESKIDIERGRSAAYEAFNVIGEVNSLEDIENYHDDWFRIRGKND